MRRSTKKLIRQFKTNHSAMRGQAKAHVRKGIANNLKTWRRLEGSKWTRSMVKQGHV